jgi:hypothetical protein
MKCCTSITALVISFLLVIVSTGFGQTKVEPTAGCGTTQIPFDFWVGGSHLPAGNYILDCSLPTVVTFRNVQTKEQAQAFLVPTGDEVGLRDHKLIFVTRNRQYYLQELWNSHGRAVLTSRFGVTMASEDIRSEIPISEDKRGKEAAERGRVLQ